jgi:hypothetical protein
MGMATNPNKRDVVLLVVIAFLSLALIYSITLQLWGIMPGEKIDYARFGTWSEAVAGIATSAAVIVALAGLYWERTTSQITDAVRERIAQTAVFHWLTFKDIKDAGNRLEGRIWDLRVQNSTNAPIYHWNVTFEHYEHHLCGRSKRPLLPGENVFNIPFLDNVNPADAPEPLLIFRSQAGTVWLRSGQGQLEEATANWLECSHLEITPNFDLTR